MIRNTYHPDVTLASAALVGKVLDLFAGPGGWDLGLRDLGERDVLGIEWDSQAVSTRRRVGLPTHMADVALLNPERYLGAEGLIASPPCQLFSAAGSGHGRGAVDLLVWAIAELLMGHDVRPQLRSDIADLIEPTLPADEAQGALLFDNVPDERRAKAEALAYNAALVVEPARFIRALEPRWIALEQVPAVLPIWGALAEHLFMDGYSVWCGTVNSADYGVPQTRRRAVLLASLDRTVGRPPHTHAEDGDGLPRWVSMAEAWRADDEPSFAVTSKARSWKLVDQGRNGAARDMDEPAPTICASHDNGNLLWLNTGRSWKEGGSRDDAQTVAPDRPAPTMTGKSGGQWQWGRPATTVMGDPRLWPPGHKVNADDIARLGEDEARERYGDRAGTDAMRLEVWQALVLQTFPRDYPLAGSRTDQFQQVGNAVPPLLARHMLAEVLPS